MCTRKGEYLSCLLCAIVCAGAAIIFACGSVWKAAALFVAGAAILAVIGLCALRAYRDTRLITDNPILTIGVASLVQAGRPNAARACIRVVISGFGILMDGRAYPFGRGGLALTEAKIDRAHITLSFGTQDAASCFRLLHGIVDKADIARLCERLRYETGVVAEVSGW